MNERVVATLAELAKDRYKVERLADGLAHEQDLHFYLARLVKDIAPDASPEDFEREVQHFHGLAGLRKPRFKKLYGKFCLAWDKIRTTEDRRRLVKAFELAKAAPVELPANVKHKGKNVNLVWSVAFHLAKEQAGGFQLLTTELSALMDVHPTMITYCTKQLIQANALVCTDSTWAYAGQTYCAKQRTTGIMSTRGRGKVYQLGRNF